jgi:hypothetical protein
MEKMIVYCGLDCLATQNEDAAVREKRRFFRRCAQEK